MPPQTIQGSPAWFRCPKGPMTLGESPIYRSSDSTLHWFDCLSTPPELYIIPVDPETGDPVGEARILPLEESVNVALFRKDNPGSYLAAYQQGICFLDEKTGRIDVVKEIIPSSQRDELRLNDGGVDAKGRFWVTEIDLKAMGYGSGELTQLSGTPEGRIWRYDPDGSLHLMVDGGITCGNGLAWSPDNKTMYYSDSAATKTFAFDFDLETGSLSNKRILIDRQQYVGHPDGMVVDTQGNLWIATYSSNRVMVFHTEGEHIRDIVFPAKLVTCPTWGGKENNIIYLTSGMHQSAQPETKDEGGFLFSYKTLEARGQPKDEFAG